MTTRERQLDELKSIYLVYKMNHKDFVDKINKGYKDEDGYSALDIFANNLETFYWCTNECIKRAEIVGAVYNKQELLDRLEAYSNEFILFYNDEKKKANTEEKLKKFKKIDKKIRKIEYINKILN